MLQNHWLTGGAGGRGGGRGRGGAPPKPITVTVTLPSGEKVEGPLLRIDDFLVTLRQADGTVRSIRRTGDCPRSRLPTRCRRTGRSSRNTPTRTCTT